MQVRLTGIKERYFPTDAERKEEEAHGLRRRRHAVLNPSRQIEGGGSYALFAECAILGSDGFDGFDLPLSDLPEGAKIGDEFSLEFKPIKKGR